MLKISDILKKAQKNKQKKKEKNKTAESPVLNESDRPEEISAERKSREGKEAPEKQKTVDPEPKQQPQQQPEEAVVEYKKAEKSPDESKALEVYKEAVGFVQAVMSPFDDRHKGSFSDAKKIVRQIIDLLNTQDNALLKLFFDDYFVEKGYIYQNAVNVCVLCLYLAIDLKYDYQHLSQLGIAALAHDIGELKFDDLISRPGRLSDPDLLEIRKHPIVGKDILKNLSPDLDFEIFDVIHQEHERIDGSGYPYGLKGKEICEYARLIGLVDVYEAMTHSRPYRKRLNHILVIKELLENKSKFEHKFLKTLIDLMGIYPISTEVSLNTKEIAQIVRQNKQMPQRPVIKVTHDLHAQPLEQPKLIDLSKNFSVYIIDVSK